MRILVYRINDVQRDTCYRLALFSDLHLGNKLCDKDFLAKAIQIIQTCDAWALLGDIGDYIFPHPEEKRWYVELVDESLISPELQYEYAYKLLEPIRRTGLVILDGNHDFRWTQRTGFNVTRQLCNRLNVPYANGFSAYVRLVFRRANSNDTRTVNIFMHHGYSASRRVSGRVLRLLELEKIFDDAKIYAMGHVHDLGLKHTARRVRVDKNNKPVLENKYFVLTGCFLKSFSEEVASLAERRMLEPASTGFIIAEIYPFKNIINFREVTPEAIGWF